MFVNTSFRPALRSSLAGSLVVLGASVGVAQTAADAMRFPVFSETRLGIFVREDVSRELGLSRLDEQRISQAIDDVLRPHRRDETRRDLESERRDHVRGLPRGQDDRATEAEWARLLRRAEDAAFRLFTPGRKEKIGRASCRERV